MGVYETMPTPNTQPSLTTRLVNERKHLEQRLEKVKRIQEGLDKNPEVRELLDDITTLGLGY